MMMAAVAVVVVHQHIHQEEEYSAATVWNMPVEVKLMTMMRMMME